MSANSELIHATCIAIDGKGVLLIGLAGSGKSDLALRLIDRGATLVSDDQVQLTCSKKTLYAIAPEQIAGLIEMRGVGIFQMQHEVNVPVVLAVRLQPRSNVERMPEPEFFDCLDATIPLLSLHAFDSSTEAKIRMFLRTV